MSKFGVILNIIIIITFGGLLAMHFFDGHTINQLSSQVNEMTVQMKVVNDNNNLLIQELKKQNDLLHAYHEQTNILNRDLADIANEANSFIVKEEKIEKENADDKEALEWLKNQSKKF